MPTDYLLTAAQVAQILRIDEQTARRYIRRGRLQSINLTGKTGHGARHRIDPNVLKQTFGVSQDTIDHFLSASA